MVPQSSKPDGCNNRVRVANRITTDCFFRVAQLPIEGDPAVTEILNTPGLVFWGAIALICVVPAIARAWSRNRQAELDAALKQEMLQRGMSADDIRTVLEASSPQRRRGGCC